MLQKREQAGAYPGYGMGVTGRFGLLILAFAFLVPMGLVLGQEGGSEGADPASEPSSAPASAPAPQVEFADDATYEAEVRETEEKVSDLKERVFRSKARLLLLKEALVGGAFGSARAIILHKDDMGRALRLQQASYSIDGLLVFNKTDVDGSLSKNKEFEVFNQPIAPGAHTVSVLLVYKGDGFGVFDYLDKYTFKIKSSFTFQVEDGKVTQVRVVGYEKGGPLVKLEDRPTVRFEQTITQEGEAPSPEGEAASAEGEEAGSSKKKKKKAKKP